MATLYASQRKKVASSHQAGQAAINEFDWNVVVGADADKVIIGELSAGHKLVGELCSFIVDANVAASNFDVCVGDDTQVIFNNIAVAGGAYARTALSAFAMIETIGVSDSNRDIYLLLNTHPATATGVVKTVIAQKPA